MFGEPKDSHSVYNLYEMAMLPSFVPCDLITVSTGSRIVITAVLVGDFVKDFVNSD